MIDKNVEIIVTLGPATRTKDDLEKLKAKGVDFVRVNLSHSSLEDLQHFIDLAKEVGIPFVLDTQGSQVRTEDLETDTISYEENDQIKLYNTQIKGNQTRLSLTPGTVVSQLEPGDLIYVDFNSLVFRVSDISTIKQGFILITVLTGGAVGKNKGVVIQPSFDKQFILPTLSEKDKKAIEIGLASGVTHIAASFMRSGAAVKEVRELTKGKMKIISKVECIDGLKNLDDIIDESEYLLIDRGDLSKEIPIEKIPFTQKIILHKAREKGKGVFVATNLLETMIEKQKPTRAEVHDILATIHDGATGLTMAAETAIGRYPMECVNMLNNLIKHAQLALPSEEERRASNKTVKHLEDTGYLLNMNVSSSLAEPHGGKLVNRLANKMPEESYLKNLQKIELNQNKQMDAEQIAVGTYSPLEGFMKQQDFQSVVDTKHLANGVVWTLPIVLDVSKEKADQLEIGKDVALTNESGQVIAILHLEEKYTFDKEDTLNKIYTTDSVEHPGVLFVRNMGDILLGGKITLLRRRPSPTKEFELTPSQTRRLFEERGWSRVVAFHTRNVIHRGHEFLQMEAMRRGNCDGLFVHPVVGKKKPGDFNAKYIIKAYEKMSKSFYPKQKVVFGTFTTYSRYGGPREAVFTAICRKNFGCSHFIVGRDHTGVKDFYHPHASHRAFDEFPDLGITAICFDKVFYSKEKELHIHEADHPDHPEEDKWHVSGTEARKMLENSELPPEWFMRNEIAQIIIDAVENNEEVFVRE